VVAALAASAAATTNPTQGGSRKEYRQLEVQHRNDELRKDELRKDASRKAELRNDALRNDELQVLSELQGRDLQVTGLNGKEPQVMGLHGREPQVMGLHLKELGQDLQAKVVEQTVQVTELEDRVRVKELQDDVQVKGVEQVKAVQQVKGVQQDFQPHTAILPRTSLSSTDAAWSSSLTAHLDGSNAGTLHDDAAGTSHDDAAGMTYDDASHVSQASCIRAMQGSFEKAQGPLLQPSAAPCMEQQQAMKQQQAAMQQHHQAIEQQPAMQWASRAVALSQRFARAAEELLAPRRTIVADVDVRDSDVDVRDSPGHVRHSPLLVPEQPAVTALAGNKLPATNLPATKLPATKSRGIKSRGIKSRGIKSRGIKRGNAPIMQFSLKSQSLWSTPPPPQPWQVGGISEEVLVVSADTGCISCISEEGLVVSADTGGLMSAAPNSVSLPLHATLSGADIATSKPLPQTTANKALPHSTPQGSLSAWLSVPPPISYRKPPPISSHSISFDGIFSPRTASPQPLPSASCALSRTSGSAPTPPTKTTPCPRHILDHNTLVQHTVLHVEVVQEQGEQVLQQQQGHVVQGLDPQTSSQTSGSKTASGSFCFKSSSAQANQGREKESDIQGREREKDNQGREPVSLHPVSLCKGPLPAKGSRVLGKGSRVRAFVLAQLVGSGDWGTKEDLLGLSPRWDALMGILFCLFFQIWNREIRKRALNDTCNSI